MADNLPPLPPGFVLDGGPTKKNAANLPPLPPGFALDGPPSEFANRKGAILPWSTDAQGRGHFDINAGIPGAMIGGFTAPGDVASGKLDPDSPEGIKRAQDFTLLVNPANPAIAAGEKAIPGSLRALRPGGPKSIPTAEQLKAAGGAGYDAARGMGVDYSADAVKSMADDITQSLEGNGIFAELAPKTFSLLSRLKEPPAGSVASLDNVITLRKSLQQAAGDFNNPTEAKAASGAIEVLDRMLGQPDPASVVAGPAAAAGAVYKDANANYAAGKRSDTITGAEERADLNAAVNNSGNNIGNQLRQRARDILVNKKLARGFTEEELADIEAVAKGTATANRLRSVGTLLGGGGGLGREITAAIGGGLGGGLGLFTGGPVGGMAGAAAGATVLPLVGAIARKASAGMTRKQLAMVDALTRKRSPLYRNSPEAVPITGVNGPTREALIRALLLRQTPPASTVPAATPAEADEIRSRIMPGVY